MATLPVINLKREEVGSIEVADDIFAAEVNRHLFYEVVKWQQAKTPGRDSRNQGTF